MGVVAGIALLAAVAIGLGWAALGGTPGPGAVPSSSAVPSGSVRIGPSRGPSAGAGGASPSQPATSRPSAAPSGPAPGAAPTSATGFKLRGTVVPMGFPLPATSRYRYGAGWLVPRSGVAYGYNEVYGVSRSGALLRAHDGLDLMVAVGTPVLAPFDGVVVDPAARWHPWDRSRYGLAVVISSSEATSAGYLALSAHLSSLGVRVGDLVTRGQVLGLTGRTGNAAGTAPHLHFELRAPFLIPQRWGGLYRRLDSFDPAPSLRGADPNRR
jgi:murein DD-endopeptidase MepM/ murein hydrolase activator NlpD